MNTLQTFRTIAIALAVCAMTTATHAKSAGGEQESRMLMHLLQMEDAELAKARETIERIEAMSPEERREMRQRLGKLQKMDPERREALRERFEAIPNEEREAMRQRWFEMSPQERMEWRKRLRSMSPEERAAVIEEEGFLPPHPKHHIKGPQSESKGPPSERKGPPPPLKK